MDPTGRGNPGRTSSEQQAARQPVSTHSTPPGPHCPPTNTGSPGCLSAAVSTLEEEEEEEESACKRPRRTSPSKEASSTPPQPPVDTPTWGVGGGSHPTHASYGTAGRNSVEGRDYSEDPLKDYLSEDFQQKARQIPREWELTQLGARYQAQGVAEAATQGNSRRPLTFTLMSYNVLAQNLIEMNPELYTQSSPRALDWQQRRRLLLAEIAFHNADILCLQEVQEDHYFDYIKPRLEKLGYRGCYQKRTGDKTDGCATLWKERQFRCLRCTPVTYCRGGLLDRDNVALVLELQPLRSQQGAAAKDKTPPDDPEDKVVVSNTHLLFNPRRGDIKLAQLMILLAEIDKRAYLGPSSRAHHQPSQAGGAPASMDSGPSAWASAAAAVGGGGERYCPVILAGDFNMVPYCSLYRLLVSGCLPYLGLVVKEISGQEESWRGMTHYLQSDFFSPSFGVTDRCQYHGLAVERLRHRYNAYSNAPPQEEEPLAGGAAAAESRGAADDDDDDGSKGSGQGSGNTEQQLRDGQQAVTAKTSSSSRGERERAWDKTWGKSDRRDDPAEVNEKTSSNRSGEDPLPGAVNSAAQSRAGGDCADRGGGAENSVSGRVDGGKSGGGGGGRRTVGEWSDLPPVMPNSSGSVSHGFNLFSAYRHKIQRLGVEQDEVTTHHSQAECSVDFVFYSVDYKDVRVTDQGVEVRVVEEGHLKLLGRYGLMAGYEMDGPMGAIPNSLLPSDHLCLVTKFLLQ